MVITFVAALLVTTTIGFAAAATTGLIYACVNNSSGTIHISNATTACASNEIQLVWNADGAQGPKGDTGATGPTGATGAAGTNGTNGVSGYQRVSLANIPVVTNGVLTTNATNLLPDGTTATLPDSCGVQCSLFVYCPTGLVPLGGGYAFRVDASSGANRAVLNIARTTPFTQDVADPEFPTFFPVGQGWRLTYNTTNIPSLNWPPAITVFAICAAMN